MKKPIRNLPSPRVLCALALAMGLVSIAHGADAPAPAGDALGPYVGIGLGLSKLGPRNEGKDGAHGERPGVAMLYGGYRLTETWGMEAGLVRLGRVHNYTTATDGSAVHPTAKRTACIWRAPDAWRWVMASRSPARRACLSAASALRIRVTPTSVWAGT